MTTLRERREARWRVVRPAIVWTLVAFALALAIAIMATASLADAQRVCSLGVDPCPTARDPRFAWLLFAVVGIPLLWLLGLLLLAVRSTTRRPG